MPSLSGVRKAAFVDDSTKTVVRFDRAHEETQADVREMLGSESSDTRGDDYFAGYESVVRWREPDLSSVSQLATWMADRTRVQMVAVGPQKILQWYEPHYIRTSQTTNTNVGDVDPLNAEMRYGGGDGTDGDGNIVGYPNGSHRIYVSRNALHPLAYDAEYSLIDTDNDGIPDGYSNSAALGGLQDPDVINGVFEAFGNTAFQAALRGKVVMPIPNLTWTLSVEVLQLHDDGDTIIGIVENDTTQAEVQRQEQIVTSTGRVSVSLTTGADTYSVIGIIAKTTNVNAQNTKVKVTKPALRVDGGTSYVTR